MSRIAEDPGRQVDTVSLSAIQSAAIRIRGVSVVTPLVPIGLDGARVLIKAESLQPIGTFKVRGAHNAIASLAPDLRARGVIAASSGNHGLGVAHSARAFGIAATVVMPADASPFKRQRIEAEGALVIDWDADGPLGLEPTAAAMAADQGISFIHPFDDPTVIAGQGTLGLEVVANVPDLAAILVPIGGGGLISGVAAAVRAAAPSARVIGVEPEFAADARDSFRAGRLVEWPLADRQRTIADGTRTNLSARTLAHILALVDDVIVVSEAEIVAAVGLIAERAHLVAEPSGALTIAAAAFHRAELGVADTATVVAVLSGGNVATATLGRMLSLSVPGAASQ